MEFSTSYSKINPRPLEILQFIIKSTFNKKSYLSSIDDGVLKPQLYFNFVFNGLMTFHLNAIS